MARAGETQVAKAMKEAKTARDMVLSWGTQRPGASMERTLNSLRLFIERKPEMVATFAHNQLTQTIERGILDKKTRHLVIIGIYMALRHWQGMNAQCCNAKAAGCTDDELMEVAFLADYGVSKCMLVESCQALTEVFDSPAYKSVKSK